MDSYMICCQLPCRSDDLTQLHR